MWRRFRVGVGVGALLIVLMAVTVDWSTAAEGTSSGAVDPDGLAKMLTTIGVKPRRAGTRLDFDLKSQRNGQEWNFAMSAVLSQDQQTIWVVAWLEELPRPASKVPAAALLRLLSANDQMGNGKFFAYDRDNRRFLLQQVIANRRITPQRITAALRDVAGSVIDMHSAWSVAEWSRQPAPLRQSSVPPAPPADLRRR